ncbi:thioredoxin-like protein [Camillea tinctor]|nr:thioredoxin-like protein [Camillea tinctor]
MSNYFLRATPSSLRYSISRSSCSSSSSAITTPATARFSHLRPFHTTSPRMTVHNLTTKAEFEEAVKNNKVVLLDCFATWCGPCKAIAPLLAKHSEDEQFKDTIYFAKIDVDDLPELSQQLGITAMPTFMIFKDGNTEPAEKLVGANPNALVQLLQKSL